MKQEVRRVTYVECSHRFNLILSFDNGIKKRVDMTPLLNGPIFEPLKKPSYFKNVRVDSELGTIVWPNGADTCPDVLYKMGETISPNI